MAIPINQIINADCVAGLSQLPAESIDLTVTSPPYDKLRLHSGDAFKFEETAQELYRVTKNGGVVVWVVGDAVIKGNKTCTSFKQALYFKEIGFKVYDVMIYQKSGFNGSGIRRYYNIFEYMFILSKGKPKTVNLIADRKNVSAGNLVRGTERNAKGELVLKRNAGTRKIKDYGVRFNIWRYSTGYGHMGENPIIHQHHSIFPLKLAEDHIKSWSNEGDLVLDPFAGSGTTAVACLKNNRQYLGYEINADYCELAHNRIETARAGGLF